MRARVIPSILFTFLTAGFALGQQQKPLQWKEYVYPNDGFALTLPLPPKINESPALPGATAYAVSLKSENSVFVVRVTHNKGNCTAALAKLKEGVLNRNDPNVDPSSLKEPSVDGNLGLEYRRRMNNDIVMDRLYCVSGRLYFFTIRWPSSQTMPAAATRILNSFRLVQQQ